MLTIIVEIMKTIAQTMEAMESTSGEKLPKKDRHVISARCTTRVDSLSWTKVMSRDSKPKRFQTEQL